MLPFHQAAALACLVAIAQATFALPVFAAPRKAKRLPRDSLSPVHRSRTRKHKTRSVTRSPVRSGSITPVHVSFIPSPSHSRSASPGTTAANSPVASTHAASGSIACSEPVSAQSDDGLSFGTLNTPDSDSARSPPWGRTEDRSPEIPFEELPPRNPGQSDVEGPAGVPDWPWGYEVYSSASDSTPPSVPPTPPASPLCPSPIAARNAAGPSRRPRNENPSEEGMPRAPTEPRAHKSRAAHVLSHSDIGMDDFTTSPYSYKYISKRVLQTPANNVKVMYTAADQVADMDAVGALPLPVTEETAYAYLTRDVPLRTHSIWVSLVAWTKEHKTMVTPGTAADFPTWWKRFKMQARDHHVPMSIAWRMANRLLPDVYQDSVMQRACHPDFSGFTSATWAQFMTRETGGKDAVLLAVNELYDITPAPSESLSTFLMRFQTIASRARSASSILELGISAQDEFRLLHTVMLTQTAVFGKWVRNEWHTQYNVQAAELRALDFTSMTAPQQSYVVQHSISTLIAAMRNIDAIKQDDKPAIIPAFSMYAHSGRATGRNGAGPSNRAAQHVPHAPRAPRAHVPPPVHAIARPAHNAPQLPMGEDLVMRVLANRFGLLPVEQQPPALPAPPVLPVQQGLPPLRIPPRPPHVAQIQQVQAEQRALRQIQAPRQVRPKPFTYQHAVTCLGMPQEEMTLRQAMACCATCVAHQPLRYQLFGSRTRVCCDGRSPWNQCPGLSRFSDGDRANYIEQCHISIGEARAANTAARRPVCHSLHVLPQPLPVAHPVIHDKQNLMPILLVTSEFVHEDRLISPHVTYVHSQQARDQLHNTAQHRYSCVELCPADVRTCLSEFARAINASPLDTSVSIALPHKHSCKASWWPYLKSYKLLKSELRPVLNSTKTARFDTWVRRPGPRVPGAEYVDPIRSAGNSVLHAANRNHSIYATVRIAFTSACSAMSLIDTGAAISVITKDLATRLALPVKQSHLTSLSGVGPDSIAILGMVDVKLPLNSYQHATVRAHVIDQLPVNTEIILGQDFLRKYRCTIEFGEKELRFTLARMNRVYKINRLYAEPACRTPAHFADMTHAQYMATPVQNRYRARITMIQRDFQVQTQIHPDLASVLADFPTVLSGVPPDGSDSRTAHCTIELIPGSTPRLLRSYRLTPLEKAELSTQIQKMLDKGWIRPSTSSWASPVLFVPKSDGGLRMCVDYRILNAQTQPLNYPMPHAQESLDSFAGSTIFSTLDLVSGFHQIGVAECDRHKTSFRGTNGQYEFNVMPMGLTNAPAIFQRAMHKALGSLCGNQGCSVVYLDDIIIHSRNLAEHATHLRLVLAALHKEGYSCTLKKCSFGLSSVPYLGHIVSADGLSPDPAKIDIISAWPTPTNVSDVRAFVGIVQYCRRFIPNLSRTLVPLTALTLKNAPFNWTPECAHAFDTLKQLIIRAPTLAMPDPNKPFQLYSDASLLGTGGILMQDNRVVAYGGRKFSAVQQRWTTTEQELYALVSNFETWRCYLEGRTDTELFTDHQPLVWLCSQPNLSRKQTRWMLYLQRFQFQLKYIPGKVNPADGLSRAPHLRIPDPNHDFTFESYDAVVSYISNVIADKRQTRASSRKHDIPLPQNRKLPPPPPFRIPAGLTPDAIYDIRRLARSGFASQPRPVTHAPDLSPCPAHDAGDEHTDLPAVVANESLLSQSDQMGKRQLLLDKFLEAVVAGYAADATFDGPALGLEQVGQFWFKDNALALPDFSDVRYAAMYQMHDAPWAAHVGRNRMIATLRSAYWWPSLDADVRTYVGSCDLCQRNKAHHAPKQNYLAPLPVPERPFQTIGIDFITQLPTTPRGYDAICVIVCHFTKLAHFIPCHTATNAKQFSTIFRKHFWRLHGLPMHIVSDRGSQFIADFWQQFCSDLGVKLRLTSSHQPSTDGQVERMNKVLEEALRSYVDVLHTDWDEWLDCAEFANNKSVAASHGMTPFSLVYHHEPLSPPDLALIQGLPLRSRANDINPAVPTLKTRAGRKHCVSWVTRYTVARRILQQAKDRMCHTANKSRVHREFAVGDMVMLNAKTFKLKKPASSEKFLPLYCGPFRVTERIGPSAYRLALPATCRIHPVVHVSKLWRYLSRPGDAQPPPPILLENAEHFKILDILSHRGKAPRRQYLVQWKGLDVLYNTWEPESGLCVCSDILEAYQQRSANQSLPLLRGECYAVRVAASGWKERTVSS